MARRVGPPRCAFSSLSRQAKYKASYIAVPPPGLRARTPRESASVLSVKSWVTSGVTSKPTTNARSYLNQTVRPRYDRAFVVGFDVTPEVTQDFTDNTEALSRGVRALKTGGGAGQSSALVC